MKAYRNLFAVAALVAFVVPQVALAAWWNPLSWNVWHIFGSIPKVQIEKTADATSALKTATTTEISETQELRKEVDNLKKQLNTTSKPKSSGNVQSSAAIKNPEAPMVDQPKTNQATVVVASPDYKLQVLQILNEAKSGQLRLRDYAQECASMVTQRKIAIQSLASDRASFLPTTEFDSTLYKSYKMYYDLADTEIVVMEQYRVYCEITSLDVINKNINKIDSYIDAIQNSNKPITYSELAAYQTIFFGSNASENTQSNIKNIIDRASKLITETNAGYRKVLNDIGTYLGKVTTPTIISVPPTPSLPQFPQTTRCTISGDGGVGLQAYVNCSTSSY